MFPGAILDRGESGSRIVGSLVLEVGTSEWTSALREAANRRPMLRELASGFTASIALGFQADDQHPDRRVLIEIDAGIVTDAHPAEQDEFATADVRLEAPCDAWEQMLGGLTEPLRAIVLRRVHVEGDKLLLVRGLPSVKALIEAAKELDASFAHH